MSDFFQQAPEVVEETQTYASPIQEVALKKVADGFEAFLKDEKAIAEYKDLLKNYAGRETPLTYVDRLSEKYGGKIYLKREDLVHGGAHKLNNALGQCMLAKYLGFKEVIAETGAGQHGVATAMAAAKLGLKARVFQGAKDVARQAPNAQRMHLFGAELNPVHDGAKTLKEAVNAAMREWVKNCHTSLFCMGSIVGPSPYPKMVRYFQRVIGDEAIEQFKNQNKDQETPDAVFACVGGGSNAAGFFTAFIEQTKAEVYACEAAGAASLYEGTDGVLHGMRSLLLQTDKRQVRATHSISAGLDYPGVGPWLAAQKEQKRIDSIPVSDEKCLEACADLCSTEGILPALESSHAVAGAKEYLKKNPGKTVVICLSGRGDKDLSTLASNSGETE